MAETQGALGRLALRLPIIQAPMAGVSTPALAAAVSQAGGLGSLDLGAATVEEAREMIRAARRLGAQPLNVNLFCHRPPVRDPAREAAWLERLTPLFERFGPEPPRTLGVPYVSFADDAPMAEMLVEERPEVVSFHFGLPPALVLEALRDTGARLIASATSLQEALVLQAAGMDAVIAQGIEAGGHRGIFAPEGPDEGLPTLDLTRTLAERLELPVIAAGGLMSGADVARALAAGAALAQLGTAFIACEESAADAACRAALTGPEGRATRLTRALSGRPARCLGNGFVTWAEGQEAAAPDYPVAYDAGKALFAAAKAAGETGFAAQWAGQGAPRARALPAAELMAALERELEAARDAA